MSNLAFFQWSIVLKVKRSYYFQHNFVLPTFLFKNTFLVLPLIQSSLQIPTKFEFQSHFFTSDCGNEIFDEKPQTHHNFQKFLNPKISTFLTIQIVFHIYNIYKSNLKNKFIFHLSGHAWCKISERKILNFWCININFLITL